MIPRAALRQSQAAKSAFSFRSISSLPSSSLRSASAAAPRSRSSCLQPLTQSIKPFPPRLTQRYLSTETEANGDKSKKEGNGAPETAEKGEDAAQKELEAKKKEVVDLKVSFAAIAYFPTCKSRMKREPVITFQMLTNFPYN